MNGFTEHTKPRSAKSRSGLFRTCMACAAVLAALVLISACGPSSPRFGNATKKKTGSVERSGARFSSREVEEEKKENDKKPDAKEIESVVSGSRDFRKERNTAITPIDQSKIMRAISRYMGIPYVYGGATPKGMDCSGYTMTVYQESIGKGLPRSANQQFRAGTPVRLQDLKFGDLVFFNTTGESGSHVGIYLGDDLFAHASVNLGVTISSLQSSYYKKRYEGARRIVVIPD
ncbi:MAG: C40 family peptidase [Ignavibacteriales bacterium]|nr:C40 family peptidase [Ignavibacteriales bacterium]